MHVLSLPQDLAAWAALAAACVALAAGGWLHRPLWRSLKRHRRAALCGLCVAASLGSFAYIAIYLRGGPRIIDATSYFLEAQAIAKGWLAFPTPDPSGAFRGRFLLSAPGSSELAVLFPPGYPAVLALGCLVGAPLSVGPLLAALLVWVTHGLAYELFRREDVALGAAALSVLCAALRYHTADTMSHGLAAVLFAGALWAALRSGRMALIAGLAVGWLCATRPVTGLTSLFFVAWISARSGRTAVPWVLLGTLPGLTLLLLHQHAATGSFLSSTQLRYYALADGPPGCFRYGFGSGIGCVFEHGDFVSAHLADGYGAVAALGTTGRRLWLHAMDVANAWPAALLALWAVWAGRREPAIRLLAFAALALVFAYAPFYFDGNYPGGGARLLAEALPLEHVVLAWGLVRLRIYRFAPAFVLAAFGLHASRDHRALADREGGAPMFEPALLEQAGIRSGLLFVNTDHGFNLAHRPGERDAQRGLVVARHRGDAHDYLLWTWLGRPPAHRYEFDAGPSRRGAWLEPYLPAPSSRFDGGALWPPLAVAEGWGHPGYPPHACAAGTYGLTLRGSPTRVILELGTETPGRYQLVSSWVADEPGPFSVSLSAGGSRWEISWQAQKGECRDTPGPSLSLPGGPFRLEVASQRGPVVLTRLEVRPTPVPTLPRKR